MYLHLKMDRYSMSKMDAVGQGASEYKAAYITAQNLFIYTCHYCT